MTDADPSDAILARLRAGDAAAVGDLFAAHRDRLNRVIAARLDPRLTRRIAPDDVLQEAFIDVAGRVGEYVADPAVPVFVWLRFLTVQRLGMMQRAHLGAGARSVAREAANSPFDADSIAGRLVSDWTSPTQAVARDEMRGRLRAALDELEPLDREVLALRHFEELGNAEVAAVLQIGRAAASKRYVRAIQRLRTILEAEA